MAKSFNQAEPINQLQIGQLVKSRAGRDLGCYYLVYKLEAPKKKTGPIQVWLVDGRERTASRPKLKNPRHLQRTRLVAEAFAAQVKAGVCTPEDTRAALNMLLREEMLQKNPDEEALANVES